MFYDPESIKWKRAMRRAVARGIEARMVTVSADQHSALERYVTSSHSHPETRHSVALVWTCEGLSTIACDCEAGQSDRVCQHMAAAVIVAYGIAVDEAIDAEPAEVVPVDVPAASRPWADGNFISDLMDPGVF